MVLRCLFLVIFGLHFVHGLTVNVLLPIEALSRPTDYVETYAVRNGRRSHSPFVTPTARSFRGSHTPTTLVSSEASNASPTLPYFILLDTLEPENPAAPGLSDVGHGRSTGPVLGGILGGVFLLTILALATLRYVRTRRKTIKSRTATPYGYAKEKGISSRDFFPLENIPSTSTTPTTPTMRTPVTPGTSLTPFTDMPPRSPSRVAERRRTRDQRLDVEHDSASVPPSPSLIAFSAARASSELTPESRMSTDLRRSLSSRSLLSTTAKHGSTPLTPVPPVPPVPQLPSPQLPSPAYLSGAPPPAYPTSPTSPLPPPKVPPSAFPSTVRRSQGDALTIASTISGAVPETRPGTSMSVFTSASRPVSTVLAEPTFSEDNHRQLQFEGNREEELQERRAQWLRMKYFQDVMSGSLFPPPDGDSATP